MALTFPSSPALNDTSVQNGRTYKWSGNAWELAPPSGMLSWSSVPASATATGTAGQVAYDSSYVYVCVAESTWVRSPLATWTLDPYWSSVSLLLHFDGNLTDSSPTPKTVTAIGNAAASAEAKFGSYSLALDGDGDGISLSDGFPRGTEDFTIEFWIYKNGSWSDETDYRVIYEWGDLSGGGVQMYLHPLDNVLRVGKYGQGDWYMTYSISSLSAATWYHVAVTRAGNAMTLFVNGSSVVSSTYTGSFGSDSSALKSIGIGSSSGSYLTGRSWPGRIDDFRITRGVARTITAAPTAAYPNG